MPNTIKTYTFKTGLAAEIEMIPLATIFQRHRPNMIEPHRADFYHIFWFTNGAPTHTVDFIPIPIEADTLLFVNKNRVHFFDQSGEYDGWMLLFTDAFFVQHPSDAQFLRHTVLFHDLLAIPTVQLRQTQTGLAVLFEQLRDELAGPNDAVHQPVLRNLLHNLLMLADRERRTQGFAEISKGPNLDYTLRFTELLETMFQHTKGVRQYARQLGIAERRLQQATAAALGKTPKQLIDERVLLESKRLLVHTNQSVKEIGFALGFDEPTNFTRFFRSLTGQTPALFRKQFAG